MGKKRIEAKLERRAMAGDVRGGRRGKWQGKKSGEKRFGIYCAAQENRSRSS